MSYTNQTTHFGIPLPVQNDLVNLLDWNPSSEAIDTALYGAQQAAETASTDIVGIKATIVQLQDADVQFQSDLNAIDGRVTSLEQTSGGLEDDIEDVADMITAREVPTAQSDQRLLVGEWFRYNGVLYVCTVQIEIGDTIVPNVNCRATNIESEIGSGSSEQAQIDAINAKLTASNDVPFRFGYDATSQKYGYILTEGGADTVIPFRTVNGTYYAQEAGKFDISDYEYVEVPRILAVSSGPTTYPSFTYTNPKNEAVEVRVKVAMTYSNVYSDAYMTVSIDGTEVKRVGLSTLVDEMYTVPANGTLSIRGDLYNPAQHSGVQQTISGTVYAYDG